MPMNCLWSPWSDWSKCSAECGEGERVRERSVVLPAKNGGEYIMIIDVGSTNNHQEWRYGMIMDVGTTHKEWR